MPDLLQQVEAAVLQRNPGYAAALQPPLAPDHVRQELKRVGLKENVEPIIQWYAWHNGTRFAKECDASRLGIAPPVISAPDAKNVAFLESLGHKLNLPKQIFDSVAFHDFDAGLRHVKLWKKFSKTNPANAVLVGRFFPFLVRTLAADSLAFDLTPDGNGRVVVIRPHRQVREAYPSVEDFYADLIRANEANQHLACIASPGAPIQLDPPVMKPAKPKRPSQKTIPVTQKSFALRTDFSNDHAWRDLLATLHKPDDELAPNLDFINDPAFAGVTPDRLRALLPDDSDHSYAFVIDRRTLTETDHPVIVVDLTRKKPKTFLAAAASLPEVEDNLSLGNMDFDEFAKHADADGVFRGFDE